MKDITFTNEKLETVLKAKGWHIQPITQETAPKTSNYGITILPRERATAQELLGWTRN